MTSRGTEPNASSSRWARCSVEYSRLTMGVLSVHRVSALKVIVASLVMLAATAAGPVWAQDLKIGYVNAVRAIEQAPQGDAALEKLEAEFGPRDRELRLLRDRIQELETNLEQNMLVMPDSERRDRELELRDLGRRLTRATQEFREDYNLRRNEELAQLQDIVYKAIVEIARERDFDLILHEGAVYASDKIDITDLVLQRLSQQQ
jgi:outer membrane protein